MVEGEGGMVPWNDYDLLLVTPDRSGWDGLARLARGLKHELGLPGLDIVPFTPQDLERSAHTMLVHDALGGHVILCGSEEVLERVPPAQVPRAEALVLLLNRMVCLLECPPEELGAPRPDPLRYASGIAKALFAVVDAALVTGGTYRVRYREKVEAFAHLCEDGHLAEAVDAALRFRLGPMPMGWDASWWYVARDHLLSWIGRLVGSPVPLGMARRLWRTRFHPWPQTLRAAVRGRVCFHRRAVECAELLVLAAAGLEHGGERLLQTAQGFLAKTGACPRSGTWAEAAEHTVRRWFEVVYG